MAEGGLVPGTTWAMDDAGIGWITFIPVGGRPPLVGTALLEGLEAAMVALTGARALVLRSGVEGTYLAGADLDELLGLADAGAAVARAREGQRVLRRLETLEAPTFAAIRGACIGAGVEVTLACAYRLAADEPRTLLSFPEVANGMVPGLGGTVRLPRLVGLEVALELLVGGRAVAAREAREIGLVDALLPGASFEDAVADAVRERLERGRVRTGARRRVPRRLLEDTAPGRRLVAGRARRRLVRGTGAGAEGRALDLVLEGLALPLERAFEREAEVAGEMLSSETARGMMHTARGLAAAARSAPAAAPVDRVGILGGGPEAAEWAHVLVSRGVQTRLRDPARGTLADTTAAVLHALAVDVRDGLLTETQADRASEALHASSGFGGFGTLDAVLIPQPDGPAGPAALADAEAHTAAECLLLWSATGALTEEVQRASGRPEQVVRVFLAPSPRKYPLLEIAGGPLTAPLSLDRTAALARQLGLTPVRASALGGGAAARLIGAYLAEALRLVAEGVDRDVVDRAMEEFGFAEGPIARAESMGARRTLALLRGLAAGAGDRFRPPASPTEARGAAGDEPVRSRIVLAVVNEAARVLEERVLPTAQLVDTVGVLALGFPRARGGLLRYADRLGLPGIVDSLAELRATNGPRFEPAALLLDLARSGAPLTGHPASSMLS